MGLGPVVNPITNDIYPAPAVNNTRRLYGASFLSAWAALLNGAENSMATAYNEAAAATSSAAAQALAADGVRTRAAASDPTTHATAITTKTTAAAGIPADIASEAAPDAVSPLGQWGDNYGWIQGWRQQWRDYWFYEISAFTTPATTITVPPISGPTG